MIEALVDSARKVGVALAEWHAEKRFAGRWEGAQFKADADRMAHGLWHRELAAMTPGAAILSEEDAAPAVLAGTDPYWLLDPLDGTASFAGGFAGWVTQVAWMENCRPVAAVVHAPVAGEMFRAEVGRGAMLNDRPLHLVASGGIHSLIDNYPEPRGIAADVMHFFKIERYIECGSIGLKVCRVAAGAADVFVKDVPVKSWDVAPADLILSEASGALTKLDGSRFRYASSLDHAGIIAARSPHVCQQLAAWHKSRNLTVSHDRN